MLWRHCTLYYWLLHIIMDVTHIITLWCTDILFYFVLSLSSSLRCLETCSLRSLTFSSFFIRRSISLSTPILIRCSVWRANIIQLRRDFNCKKPFCPHSDCDERRIWWSRQSQRPLTEPGLPWMASTYGAGSKVIFQKLQHCFAKLERKMEALRLYRSLLKVARQYEIPYIRKRMM